MKNGKHITLGIESSCDETAIAVLADGREILSNIISSQIEIHKEYGGVVPEIASRHHLKNIPFVFDHALEEAGVTLEEVDEIGVTAGPGLAGALLIPVILLTERKSVMIIVRYIKTKTPGRKAENG